MTVSGGTSPSTSTSTPSTSQTIPAGTGSSTAARGNDTSRVSMTTDSDFWGDLNRALVTMVGATEGRSVIVNPSSGVVLVRALPTELRNVEKYLKATQLIAERQVMLEAKIIDVTLSEDFQAGVNWGAFRSGPNSFSGAGVAQPGATLTAGAGSAQVIGTAASPTLSVTPGAMGSIAASVLGKGFIGLAFQTANFAALLNFLETQGSVSVLSSPRIATLNNQKAVLKVGTDELFVTNVTSSTTTTTTGSVSSPSVTLQPYFSGISLDVTPQIDEDGNIILHVHPAVSTVVEKEKTINLGALGTYILPLAASSINETDSIVRVQDGNIVAIGGLMRQEQSSDRSQLPGASGAVANALGQRSSGLRKRELVILIKPTMIDSDRAWTQDIRDVQDRVREYSSARPAQ
jgi:MSHA biogenesis protein MshL